MNGPTPWTDDKKALLALLILCDEHDEDEAQEQFPRSPGSARSIKRRAAEWLASRLSLLP